MAKTEQFEKYSKEYDDWFENNKSLYQEELKVLRKLVDNAKNGLEIGIGTGRFAVPIGIEVGIEPSVKMRDIAISKGLRVVDGVAEELPFKNGEFDFAIMVTTICFVDDLLKSFKEAFRVIRQNGFLIIGFIDKDSKLGIEYQEKSKRSNFYVDAKFHSTDEIINLLKIAGFSNFEFEYVKDTEKSFIFLKSFKL